MSLGILQVTVSVRRREIPDAQNLQLWIEVSSRKAARARQRQGSDQQIADLWRKRSQL